MVPYNAGESISIAVAAKLSGKAGNTIRLWAEQYGIGRKIGGDWHISRVALRMFLDGDMVALAAYHAGKRADPTVRSYLSVSAVARCYKIVKLRKSHKTDLANNGSLWPSSVHDTR